MPKLKRKYAIEVEGPLGHWFERETKRYGICTSNKKRCKTRRRARALMLALGPGSRMLCWRRFRNTAHLGVTMIREEVYDA